MLSLYGGYFSETFIKCASKLIVMDTNYHEFQLDNGLFVALQKTHTRTVSGRLRVFHGALHEMPGEEGIAHFLEHALMGGGSQKFDPLSAERLRRSFGSFNAYTFLEKTIFPVDTLAEDVPLFLDYVSDLVFNPGFDAKVIEQERQRVLRELADKKSNRNFEDNKRLEEAFYGKNSPHARLVLGEEAVVSSASIEKLGAFHQRGYHPNNMDLILVGNLPENIDKLIEQNFAGACHGDGRRIEFPRNQRLTDRTLLRIPAPDLLHTQNPEQSSAELYISLFAPPETDEDGPVVGLLIDYFSGMLHAAVSSAHGLAYSIHASYDGTNNKGAIGIQGRVQATKANEAIYAIFNVMHDFRTDLVPDHILNELKKRARYNLAKTFEMNGGIVRVIEERIDHNLTPEIYLSKINAITPEMMREVARNYFPECPIEGKYTLLLRDPLMR